MVFYELIVATETTGLNTLSIWIGRDPSIIETTTYGVPFFFLWSQWLEPSAYKTPYRAATSRVVLCNDATVVVMGILLRALKFDQMVNNPKPAEAAKAAVAAAAPYAERVAQKNLNQVVVFDRSRRVKKKKT